MRKQIGREEVPFCAVESDFGKQPAMFAGQEYPTHWKFYKHMDNPSVHKLSMIVVGVVPPILPHDKEQYIVWSQGSAFSVSKKRWAEFENETR